MLLLLATLAVISSTRAVAQSSWTIESVDSGVNVIGGNEIALTATDEPRIAYWDGNTQNLKYAARTNAGWTIEIVENTGNWEPYLGLALDDFGNPHISYFAATVQGLKWARRVGGAWLIEAVDTSGRVGVFSSIAVDQSGEPRIAYFSDANQSMRFAQRAGSAWSMEQVDALGGVAALAIDASGDPHVTNKTWDNSSVRYYRRTGGVWTPDVIDGTTRFYGDAPIALDSAEEPQIVYLDRTALQVYYMRRVAGLWQSESVDVGDGLGRSAFALDSNDRPRFLSRLRDEWTLSYVTRNASGWTAEAVAPVGVGGGACDLAMSSTDLAHIMYYDAATTSLMYAAQNAPPTAVGGLSSLDAMPTADGILVQWRVRTPYEHLGFIVLRAESGTAYQAMNDGMIPSGATETYEWLDRTASAGVSYRYRIMAIESDGSRVTLPELATSTLWALAADRDILAYPNPASGPIEVLYRVPVERDVDLAVYDVSGRRIKSLAAGRVAVGVQSASWDRRDDSGAEVATGVYFLRLRVGDGHEVTERVTVVR